MKVRTLVPNLQSEAHYIHLAAIDAPSLDIPVQFADEASRIFSAYRDKYNFCASEMKARCGNIYNSRNHRVGRVSYNGRIWDANDNPIE
jgi:hypothetical protein